MFASWKRGGGKIKYFKNVLNFVRKQSLINPNKNVFLDGWDNKSQWIILRREL